MELTKDVLKLICDLEYKIGSQCYQNNNFCDDFIQYRYPVCTWISDPNDKVNHGSYEKVKKNVWYAERNVTEDTILEMRYNIGKNKLYVGKAIIAMLEYLEHEYGLDFNELASKKRLY